MFIQPEMEVIVFDDVDIIRTSTPTEVGGSAGGMTPEGNMEESF